MEKGDWGMKCTNAWVYEGGAFVRRDFVSPVDCADSENLYILPGLADAHVHLREPGFSSKETIATGSRAAAHGGFTAVCAMPNLSPVPDSAGTLEQELEIIRRDACVRVVPYGAITKGEKGEALSDMEDMAGSVCGFSDDGRGVQSREMMRDAMLRARALGRPIAAHCEDNSLLRGGYIHDGGYARLHGHRGICSESEWGPIARDVELVRETGCAYHVCHISTKESVEIIRAAKKEGLPVTCETAPHYLLLDDSMLQEDGRFKMNPPLRSREDREAILEGFADGTVDMLSTDHAPHTREEKSRGLEKSLMGVVGLETAFPLMYTYLVEAGKMPLADLMERMCFAPRRVFGLPTPPIEEDFTVFDLDEEYGIDPETFLSMGRSTPFSGWKVRGKCLLTVCGGRIAYRDERLN